jgi:hypothetical protein
VASAAAHSTAAWRNLGLPCRAPPPVAEPDKPLGEPPLGETCGLLLLLLRGEKRGLAEGGGGGGQSRPSSSGAGDAGNARRLGSFLAEPRTVPGLPRSRFSSLAFLPCVRLERTRIAPETHFKL